MFAFEQLVDIYKSINLGIDSDRKSHEWYEHCEQYSDYLQSFIDELPEHAQKIINEINLRDQIVLKHDLEGNKFIIIIDPILSEKIKLEYICPIPPSAEYQSQMQLSQWFNHKKPPTFVDWRYDEFHKVSEKLFTHEILLSDLSFLKITFTDLKIIGDFSKLVA